jgi:hypothetical protein
MRQGGEAHRRPRCRAVLRRASDASMRTPIIITCCLALNLAFSLTAHAQGRGPRTEGAATMNTGPVHPAAGPVHAQPAVSTSSVHPRAILVSPNSRITVDDVLGSFPVPGLGFDFAHLAAINSGAGVRALIDPVTQHERALARAIRRETPVSFATFPGLFPSSQLIIVEPSIVIVPQAVAPAAETPDRNRAQESDTHTAPPPVVEPTHEAGEFVLVRRDGGLLFAVAFTQGAERVTYVTKEGIRRGLALADIDVEATARMNEERGTPLQFSETFRR